MWGADDMEEGVVVSSTQRKSGSGQGGWKVVERARGLVWRAEDGSPRSASPCRFPVGPCQRRSRNRGGGRGVAWLVTTLGGPVAVGLVVGTEGARSGGARGVVIVSALWGRRRAGT